MKSEFLKELQEAIEAVCEKHMNGDTSKSLLMLSCDTNITDDTNIFGALKGYEDLLTHVLIQAMSSDEKLSRIIIDSAADYALSHMMTARKSIIAN